MRPVAAVHSGSVLAAGVALDVDLMGTAVARHRILGLRAGGALVYRVDAFLVVRFAAPVRMSCDRAIGAPLVRYGRWLSSAPLRPSEVRELDLEHVPLADACVLVARGGVRVDALSSASQEDPATWIDTSDFTVDETTRTLGPKPPLSTAAIARPGIDLRVALGAPALSSASASLVESLSHRGQSGFASGSSGGAAASLLGGLWSALTSLAAAFFRSTAAPSSGGSTLARPPPRPLAFWQRARDFAYDVATRALAWSRLSRLLGLRQARYLSEMLAMFDAQDLDEALHHAIPLNDEVEAGIGRAALGTPAPRRDLGIEPGRGAASSSLGLGGDLFELLKRKYRRAFDRLVERGEIEKAAFVLAELLNANEEAVSFLERHGRLKLAAEIAEARKLAPGLVVRQWFLAGDHQRAVRFARMTGAFGDAVVRLERSHAEAARSLRLLWASSLADSGSYAAAVDTVWPIVEARGLGLAWLERAIAVGGPTAARMLVKKVRLAPECFDEVLLAVEAQLDHDDAGAALASFARELTAEKATDESRVLAKEVARRLVGSGRAADAGTIERLVESTGDAVFRADVAACAPSHRDAASALDPRLAARAAPLEIAMLPGDGGAMCVYDAQELPDGRMLVALGEAGVWLLGRDGRVQVRFGEPAHQLVLSDHGDRAVLVADRGEARRLARIDLTTRRVQSWCDARIDRFASTFDGSTWIVSHGGSLLAIDATSPDWEHLSSIGEDARPIHDIARTKQGLAATYEEQDGELEVWTFDPSSLLLRSRVRADVSGLVRTALTGRGTLVGWRRPTGDAYVTECRAGYLNRGGQWVDLPLVATMERQDPRHIPFANDDWFAFPVVSPEGLAVHLVDATGHRVRAILRFPDGPIVGVRFQGTRALVFDTAGRVSVLSLESGHVLRHLRL